MKIGDRAPDFNLPNGKGENLTLSTFKGRNLVIYFYPKDNTPGCTIEAKDFRDNMFKFQECSTSIIGVSKDSIESHQKFAEKQCLSFDLLSDQGGTMCEDYGVWAEKSMLGKKYMGVERTTFLIDKEGIIRKIWPKVSVGGHVQEVLKAARAL